jgi:transcriptional regulator with XRE-family HTH domain
LAEISGHIFLENYTMTWEVSGRKKDIIMKKTIGKRISEARRAMGIKQDELAEAMGVSAQAVSKWENDLSCPDISILPSLAKKLGMTVDELLSGKEEAPTATVVPESERKDFDKMMLRIKILSHDNDKVNVNLPLPLLKALLAAGVSVSSMGGEKMNNLNIDWNGIIDMVEHGVIGKIVEVESGDGDTVEIVVE